MASDALGHRLADLQGRAAALQDATSQLMEQIDRLANFDFQPGAVPLDAGEEDNVGAELSAEINQFLREQEEELELLHEEVLDLRPGKGGGGDQQQHDKDRLKDSTERLQRELQSCRIYFRKAQIVAKRNLQEAQKQERELLYASFAARPARSGASSPAPSQHLPARRKYRPTSEMSKEELMISRGNDVTAAMRRTHDLMVAELSRSDFAHRTLKESTAALSHLSDAYASLDGMLARSRDLLGTLLRSQKSDTWYLQTSFYFLVATVAWLVFRRFLYGPAWWLLWLPLKLLFRGGLGASRSVMGLHGGVQDPAAALESPGVRPGAAEVEMNNNDVPTARVGHETPRSRKPDMAEDPDSMVEQVGRMTDESQGEGEDEGAALARDILDSQADAGEPSDKEENTIQEPETSPDVEPGPERVRVEL